LIDTLIEIPKIIIFAKIKAVFFMLEDIVSHAEKSIFIFTTKSENKIGPNDAAKITTIKMNFVITTPYLNSKGM